MIEDAAAKREEMVDRQIAGRGVGAEAVLEAMRAVPREAFVPEDMQEFAYLDTPLPIGEGQTISQPYVVARMIEALGLSAEGRVLDVGTGSGYAAAVMSRIAGVVYTVERHASLAEEAARRFERLGYGNVHVRVGDGTRGWAEHAPFDAIAVAAAGPEVPRPLKDQLAEGGRLVIPAGPEPRLQRLVRIERKGKSFEEEDLGGVRFVPLIGEEGWNGTSANETSANKAPTEGALPKKGAPLPLPERIAQAAEPIPSIEGADLGALLERVGDAQVVLLGEATHGTSEFYRMRATITKALIREKGFRIVGAEADWPDAARVDTYVRGVPSASAVEEPFSRFPTWMWANAEFLALVEWLKSYNEGAAPKDAASFHGLDLYSLHASIASVLAYLEDVDPEAARTARERYGCLSPYERDPATYGRAALSGRYRECEPEVVAMLKDLLDKRMDYAREDGQRFLDAVQNARLVANAERYYRAMYYGGAVPWNLRDEHMFDTLRTLLGFRGPEAKAVVWAHNSHLGDASATEMGARRGQHNVGQLCREEFGQGAYLVGFGTDRGTVAAASSWGGAMEVKKVRPAHERSYERLMHEASTEEGGPAAFLLGLRAAPAGLREALLEERLERAIGVIYRPETELQSHYFQAALPRQFDEYVWLDETEAVTPLSSERTGGGVPGTFPFGA